jgi:acylphosphatase
VSQETLQRLHAFIDGTVQGVGFRAFVQEQALALGVTGWVRNTYNGEVEVLAEGPRAALDALMDKLRTGPRMAFVTEVRKTWETSTGEYFTFNVRRSV